MNQRGREAEGQRGKGEKGQGALLPLHDSDATPASVRPPCARYTAFFFVTNPLDNCGIVERLVRVGRDAANPAAFLIGVLEEWQQALGPQVDVELIGEVEERYAD
jgi:hypothetical protein